jgi:mannose-6-phosphate isomerase
MGAHPKAPSLVETDRGWRPLDAVIEDDPEAVLGQWLSRRFQGRFPFLFKVLAAAAPLSIQAHPDKARAKKGFAAENRLGLPLNAPERNYKDDNHKPECICALEPFWAICGFRRISDILADMGRLSLPELEDHLAGLRRQPDRNGLRQFFQGLMTADPDARNRLVQKAAAASAPLASGDPAFHWVVRLNSAYPGDIGVLSPLMMNLIRLEPGQALFLSAGELHAYLEGVGIELMANSDNVLRGGLTSKHMDIPELMACLNFGEREIDVLTPRSVSGVEQIYPTPTAEFQLSILRTADGVASRFSNDGVQILLCVGGSAELTGPNREWRLAVEKGASVLVPAGVHGYRIAGRAEFYKASTPPRPEGADGAGHPPESS